MFLFNLYCYLINGIFQLCLNFETDCMYILWALCMKRDWAELKVWYVRDSSKLKYLKIHLCASWKYSYSFSFLPNCAVMLWCTNYYYWTVIFHSYLLFVWEILCAAFCVLLYKVLEPKQINSGFSFNQFWDDI